LLPNGFCFTTETKSKNFFGGDDFFVVQRIIIYLESSKLPLLLGNHSPNLRLWWLGIDF